MACLLVFLLCFGFQVSAEEHDRVSVGLQAAQKFERRRNVTLPEKGQKVSYELTPLADGNPMPEEGERYVFELEGDQKKDLPPMIYTEAGVYSYHLKPVQIQDRKGYAYDQSEYTVVVHVTNSREGLSASVFVKNEEGDKCEEILYIHSYKAPSGHTSDGDEPDEGAPGSPPSQVEQRFSPRTGDDTAILPYAALLLLAVSGIFVLRKRRKSK